MRHSDDAGVYRISDELALVQTLDFITPIVDDPYVYGQIAAANSISDVYAMGAKPIHALNIVCFPSKTVPMDVLGQILAGGADKAREAEIEIIGGHSVDDREPKYGLVVTGTVSPQRIFRNGGAKAGDKLILTKPLGSGIVTTGIKFRKASDRSMKQAIDVMTTLNRDAAAQMSNFDVHAVTDVTGFGLLGHLLEMLTASHLSARLSLKEIPFIEDVWELAGRRVMPGGAKRNLKRVESAVGFDNSLPPDSALVLNDPQTSGGLLMAVDATDAAALLDSLQTAGVSAATLIGELTADSPSTITVHA